MSAYPRAKSSPNGVGDHIPEDRFLRSLHGGVSTKPHKTSWEKFLSFAWTVNLSRCIGWPSYIETSLTREAAAVEIILFFQTFDLCPQVGQGCVPSILVSSFFLNLPDLGSWHGHTFSGLWYLKQSLHCIHPSLVQVAQICLGAENLLGLVILD